MARAKADIGTHLANFEAPQSRRTGQCWWNRQNSNKVITINHGSTMQIKSVQKQIQKGFTLIEMIGVLAVIAILLALLVPKIFEAINSARVNNAAGSYNTIKTALMDHYGKFGAVGVNGAAYTAPIPNYDTTVLLPEQIIDKPFAVRIGSSSGTLIQVVDAPAPTAAVTATGPEYNLLGTGTVSTLGSATWVAEAVIAGVDIADARELNNRLDGPALGTTGTDNDYVGRVKFAYNAGTTVVHIYIAHR